MHIMEGYLPPAHAVGWAAASAPFFAVGVWKLGKMLREQPRLKLLLGAVGGFAFVLSALKIPSVTGSCSHPTGVGMGSVIVGPWVMTVIGFIVLLFQALLLAHGGVTTLGANVFSMAIVGPWVAFGVYMLARKCRLPWEWGVFLGAMLGDLATYAVTAGQLAAAHPDPLGGFAASFVKFAGVFALTQIPLAISEGLLSVFVINLIRQYSQRDLQDAGMRTDNPEGTMQPEGAAI